MSDNTSLKSSNQANQDSFDSRLIYNRILGYLWQHRTLFLIALAFLIIVSLIQVGIAAILEPIVNQGLVERTERAGIVLPLAMFCLMVGRAIVGYIAAYSMFKVGRSVIRDIRKDLFAKFINLPTHFFEDNSSAELVSKLIYDVEQTANATTETLTNLVRDSFTAIGLIAWMLYLNWQMTLVGFACVPFVVWITSYSNRRFRKTSKEIQESMGEIAGSIKEVAVAQKIVKIYGGEAFETERFAKTNSNNLHKNLRRAKVSAGVVPATMVAIAPVFALVLYIYLNHFTAGTKSAGEFVSFLGAFVMLMSPLKRLAKVNEKIQIGVAAAHSVFQIIDAEPEPDNGTLVANNQVKELRFEGVSFHYLDENQRVLNDIDFTVKAGQKIALVGASGSGKSTIASLIMRLYESSAGRITLNGTDILDFSMASYRDLISYVSQETILFDDTIKNNIAYGVTDTEANPERLDMALKAGHVAEFVTKLPEGVDSLVGEQGLRLSGGQRQRIAIARAIYKNSPIIILDEATSALDTRSEKLVQDAMTLLMQNRTSIIIAHRLSTIQDADLILVLKEGEIIEYGNHQSLLAADGLYTELNRTHSYGEVSVTAN